MSDESRKQFEQWAVSRYGENYVHLDLSTMKYDVQLTQSHWECWKESRAALVVELPDYTDDSDDELSCFDGEYEWGNRAGATYAVNQCANTLRAAGITVKGEGGLISTPDHVLDKKWHDHFGKGGGDETNPNDSR